MADPEEEYDGPKTAQQRKDWVGYNKMMTFYRQSINYFLSKNCPVCVKKMKPRLKVIKKKIYVKQTCQVKKVFVNNCTKPGSPPILPAKPAPPPPAKPAPPPPAKPAPPPPAKPAPPPPAKPAPPPPAKPAPPPPAKPAPPPPAKPAPPPPAKPSPPPPAKKLVEGGRILGSCGMYLQTKSYKFYRF